MAAYYNEIDPYAAQWLRNLISAGHIAPGDVDERSIEDVRPDDLRGYTQCHFFAGIGAWSYALRLAGWADDRPVWTGSCPCQPFSAAGKGAGFADERHLWPAWFHLIEQCCPNVVFGEQVEAAIKHDWLDLVQSDMEGIGYVFAPVGVPAAGVGAPHIRQRLWFVADADREGGHDGRRLYRGRAEESGGNEEAIRGELRREIERNCAVSRVGIADGAGRQSRRIAAASARYGDTTIAASDICGLADADEQQRPRSASRCDVQGRRNEESTTSSGLYCDSGTGPTNGHWRNADWLGCRDGKWRPVEPGLKPLVTGAASRVGRLRAYGNAICAEVAKEVIQAYMSIE